MIHTLTQGHFVPMVTPAAILRCVGRVDFDELSASFFRFARQFLKKPCPRGIMNAFRETMIMGHTVDLQVFHADDTEAIYDLPTLLMREIIPSKRYPFMHTSDNLAMFSALRCPFRKFGVRALDTDQGLLFLAEKAGIRYLFCIGKRSEGLESNINTHLGSDFWQPLGLTLDRETYIPFARAASLNSTRFDLAFERPMVDHLDTSNLGECHTVIMRDAEPALREGEAIIAVFAPKAREARLFTCFAASEKGFEGQINPHGNVLQHLGMNDSQGRMLFFQYREGRDLPIAGQTFTSLLIGVFALLQQVVVEPTAFIKRVGELRDLLLRRVETILKHFVHRQMVAQPEQRIQIRIRSTPAPNKERLSSPASKTGVFKRS